MSGGTNIYRWKRFHKQKKREKRDDIQSWLDKVEAATESAVSSAFSTTELKDTGHHSCRYKSSCDDDIMQLVGDIHDNETAHDEAKELVSDWINEKIRYDFLKEENDCHSDMYTQSVRDSQGLTAGIESAGHEKWYEDSEAFLQRYLNSDTDERSKLHHKRAENPKIDILGQLNIYEADESTVVDALMKNMMEKPLIKPSEMKVLKKKTRAYEKHKTNKLRDPKMTMDIRQKEVKEARLRRQKEEEKRRQEKMIQKEAKLKAQMILREEEMQKKLRKKQEEEAIQAEMAKIRKAMIEQRKVENIQRREGEKALEKVKAQEDSERIARRLEMEQVERERQKKVIMNEIVKLEEKQEKIAEIMKMRNVENRRILQTCFSTWCKVVLQQRVKLGKAKAMSDWKCMQRAWSGWKSYTMNHQLERETESHQANVREARIKEKKAVNCARTRLLRKSFFVWKIWVKTEQERKEILKQQETTKAKMQALLNAVTASNTDEKEEVQPAASVENNQRKPHSISQQRPLARNRTKDLSHGKLSSKIQKTGMPKEAWQVTRKDVHRLKPEEMMGTAEVNGNSETSSQSRFTQPYDPYQNRHKFQKELIDQQRMLLQEQKRMIEEMQEQRRLGALQQEIEELKEQKKALENIPANSSSTKPKISSEVSSVQSSSPRDVSGSARSVATKKHPIVSKMEERAAERAKRKKELEEIKRKREEEKRKKMQELEEQKKIEEEEKKRKELQERREAKRLQRKMEEEKKAAQERMRELCKMADNHYLKNLVKIYGFQPWKKLLINAKRKMEIAQFHAKKVLLTKSILEWRHETRQHNFERAEKADALNRILLLRRGMRCWKKYGERMDILEQKAVLHHNKVLMKSYVKTWVDYTTDEKLSQWRKESQADDHNRLRLLKRVFNVIRSYRALIKMEGERRKRIDEMRKKVTQLLPDFQCSKDSLLSDNFDDENITHSNGFTYTRHFGN